MMKRLLLVSLSSLVLGSAPTAHAQLMGEPYSPDERSNTGETPIVEVVPTHEPPGYRQSAGRLRAPAAGRASYPTRVVSAEAVQRALQRYAGEPRVERVVAEALVRVERDAERVEGLVHRSRQSALLPDVRMAAQRHDGRRLLQPSLVSEPTARTLDAGLTLEASLAFHLDRLVYGRDEVSIARHRRSVQHDRDETVRVVVELYYVRRRLQLERDLGEATIDGLMRLAEAQALLDALTGGAFAQLWTR